VLGIAFLAWGISMSLRAKGTGFGNKTLYDWLNLLIVPAVLSVAAFLFNREEREAQNRSADQRAKAERELADQRAQIDREISSDRSCEDRLQEYLDRMTNLLLEKGLRNSEPEAEIRVVARARTLTALDRLDGPRKGVLLSFLKEADLISQGPEFTQSKAVISLNGADLTGAILLQANLRGTDLRGVCLGGADLRWAQMDGANLAKADFRASNLHKASLRYSHIRAANFSNANLSEASLVFAGSLPSGEPIKPSADELLLFPVRFSGANLVKADLDDSYLHEADLSESDLSEAYLGRADLWRANLSKAKMRGSNMRGAYLSRANLSGADLTKACLSNAYLGGTDLSHADMSEADLTQANLHPSRSDAKGDLARHKTRVGESARSILGMETELDRYIELSEYLRAASLSGTNLSGADLTDAKIAEQQLAEAASLQNTKMPNGTRHE
jgi:uncharacterized protein YjbI with pentapeptide repeats